MKPIENHMLVENEYERFQRLHPDDDRDAYHEMVDDRLTEEPTKRGGMGETI